MTTTQLTELRKLLAEATPGPWVVGTILGQCHLPHIHDGCSCVYDRRIETTEGCHEIVSKSKMCTIAGNYDYEEGGICSKKDAALIAAAVNALPSLLAAAEREAKLREALHDIIEELIGGNDPDTCETIEKMARAALTEGGAK